MGGSHVSLLFIALVGYEILSLVQSVATSRLIVKFGRRKSNAIREKSEMELSLRERDRMGGDAVGERGRADGGHGRAWGDVAPHEAFGAAV